MDAHTDGKSAEITNIYVESRLIGVKTPELKDPEDKEYIPKSAVKINVVTGAEVVHATNNGGAGTTESENLVHITNEELLSDAKTKCAGGIIGITIVKT